LKKKNRNRLILFIMLLCITAPAVWWVLEQKKDAEAAAPKTIQTTRRDVASTVLATGAIRAQIGAEVRVGARISGKVEHLYANIGDKISKGQVIAELEHADLDAAVARLEAEVQVSRARIVDAESRLKLARLEYQRQKNLIKKDFTSQEALDKALKEKESAAAGKKLATRQLDVAQAALTEARVKRSYATLTAPISGVIASVSTQEGETVAAGLNAPTFVTIIDLTRIQVDAFVDETDIGRVKGGQKATFTVDTYPGKEFAGVVSAIYPKAVIQDNVVNYDVVITIKSPEEDLLRPDMTTSVTIYEALRKGVLMIPQQAIVRENGQKYILLQQADNSIKKQPVQTGPRHGNMLEVIKGLHEGETLILPR